MSAGRLPRISIVTPSFNQGEYLDATIRSVLGQGYPDLEYIVMDGGSSDGSREIIRRHERWLSHWESSPDGGQADAIRRGFERATGDILGWVNSDDLLLRGALERVGRYFLAHPSVAGGVGGGVLIGPEGRLLQGRTTGEAFTLGEAPSFRSLLYWEMGGFYQPACFWRRDAYLASGGVDPSFRFCMDLDLLLRLAQQGRFGRIPGFLCAFRHHPGSKSATLGDVCREEKARIRGRYPAHSSLLRRTLLRRYFVLRSSVGKRLCHAGHALGRIRLPDLSGWPPGGGR